MTLCSIIVPVYNRPNDIDALLQQLQALDRSVFEIVVVNDGSTDDTIDRLKAWDGISGIRVLHQDNLGVSSARNAGARVCQGDYIVFLDCDDALIFSGFLELERIARQSTADLLVGYTRVVLANGRHEVIQATLTDPLQKQLRLFKAGAYWIRRSLFLGLGGFDTEIRFGENTELVIRALESNHTVFQIVPHNVLTYYPSTSGGSKNLQNKLAGNLVTLRKHERFFQHNPSLAQAYWQVAGVSAHRLGDYRLGRSMLYKAWRTGWRDWKSWVRLILAYSPLKNHWSR